MSAPANCSPCCSTDITTQVPGSAGATGAAGADGISAFDLTQADFAVPAIGDSVSVTGADNSWAAIGQTLFIEDAGFFTLTGKAGSTIYTLEYQDVEENTHATDNIVTGATIAAAGSQGAAGTPIAPASGDPEGVITASPGETYLNTDDDSFWVKRTGTGNTGWGDALIT